MALFGSKKANVATDKSVIQSQIFQTENVARELLNTALRYDISVFQLDFYLLKTKTFTRIKNGNGSDIWEENGDNEVLVRDESLFLNPNFEIKQSYEIEVVGLQKDYLFNKFHVSVGANSTFCKIYLSIAKGSVLTYNEEIVSQLETYINKKKVRANILIDVFDNPMHDFISKMYAKLRIDSTVLFEKDEMFLISQGIEPVSTVDDDLIFHFKKKKDTLAKGDERTGREFIISVVKDELLIEYIKPKKGSPGRNCKGVYLGALEPKISHKPTFKVSNNISVIDNESSIEYRANQNGYIVFENDTYDIKEELDIDEISFKTTGSIITGMDAEINLNVKEKDVFKDAIGTGMDVEVNEIEVEGNVGPKAKIVAKTAKIDGQTHGTSHVRADKLTINIHRGFAEGEEVNVTRLERGKIVGKKVSVTQALSGDIRGEHVVVELLGSHVTITASRTIEIKKMQGSENKLIIDPTAISQLSNNAFENDEKIKDIDHQIKEMNYEVQKYVTMVHSNEQAYKQIKKRLLHYQKNKIKLPVSLVRQFKEFKTTIEHLESLQDSLKSLIAQRERLNIVKQTVQEHIFEARIINRDKWVGYNEIVFHLIDPPTKLSYTPKEGSREMVFGIDEDEDGAYRIKGKKE